MHFDTYEIKRQVIAFMEASGITPPRDGLILDGQKHRYQVGTDRRGSRSGAYCIYPDNWPAGWVQDFHLGEPITWKFDASGLDSNTRAEWKRRAGSPEAVAAREAKKAEDEAQRQNERAAKLKLAWSAYQAARPIEEACDHPYLLEKHVRPVGPLRVGSMLSKSGKTIGGVLFIPLFDVASSKFIALHRIFPWRDKETGKFPKGWHPGTNGGVFPIGTDLSSGPVFVCEGVSTGLALYDYLIDELNELSAAVLMAMDAGNFARQAPAIRARYLGRELYGAVDDDEAGRKTAATCREAGFNGIIMPPLACGEAV